MIRTREPTAIRPESVILPAISRRAWQDSISRCSSRATATQLKLDGWSVVEVDQFYGIEIGEFPARIAATSLWMMDHIMNNRLSLEFGQTYAPIPIEKSLHIRNADALEFAFAHRTFAWGSDARGEAQSCRSCTPTPNLCRTRRA